jgi:signal transduction histidine kinase
VALCIAVAIVAVAGFVFVLVQEKNKIHLAAEYQAYQFATLLLQEAQGNYSLDYEKIDDLVAFGVYSSEGNALFRTTQAPKKVKYPDAMEDVRIDRDKIRLLLRVGGGMSIRYGPMKRADGPAHGRAGDPPMERFFYIEYAAPVLAQRISPMSLVGILASFALLFAFGLIGILFRRLEAFRAMEAKNMELAALGDASRILAHEIKNPLAIILLRCGLIKKRFGEEGADDATVIEEETRRIASLVDRIRQVLISGSYSIEGANLEK